MKNNPKTYLDIGSVEQPSTPIMKKVKPGDHYISLDLQMPERRGRRPSQRFKWKERSLDEGVTVDHIKGDAFAIPLKAGSVDHVASTNVITDPDFSKRLDPSRSFRASFGKAMGSLEQELHRVTKPGATVVFHEYFTPTLLLDEPWPGEIANLGHFERAFSPRWSIKRFVSTSRQPHNAMYRKFLVIKLVKK